MYVQCYYLLLKIILLGCNNSLCNHMSSYNCVINFDFLLKRGSYFITRTKKNPCFQAVLVSAILTKKSRYGKFYIWICNKSKRYNRVLKLPLAEYLIFAQNTVYLPLTIPHVRLFSSKSNIADDKLNNFSYSRICIRLSIMVMFILLPYQHPCKTYFRKVMCQVNIRKGKK